MPTYILSVVKKLVKLKVRFSWSDKGLASLNFSVVAKA
jgi:hypothetical protein